MDLLNLSDSKYLPGASSFVYQLDKRVMCILRDGRHFIGILRSFDQYMSLVLEETVERVILAGLYNCWYLTVIYLRNFTISTEKYADIPLGLFIIRGESIVLLAEVDQSKEADGMKLSKVDPEFVKEIGELEKNSLQWEYDV